MERGLCWLSRDTCREGDLISGWIYLGQVDSPGFLWGVVLLNYFEDFHKISELGGHFFKWSEGMVIVSRGSWYFNHVFSLKAKVGKMDAVLLALCYDPVVFDSLKSKRKSTEVWRGGPTELRTILHSILTIFWKVFSEKNGAVSYRKNKAVTKLAHCSFALN